MLSPDIYYQQKIVEFTQALDAIKQKVRLTAWLRLFSFLGFVVSVYFMANHFTNFLLFLAILFFAGFIILVRTSNSLDHWRALHKQLLFINTNELSVIKGGVNAFDSGAPFASGGGWTEDLDIFGDHSIFHLLNRTTTSHGSQRLASLLKNPMLNKADIETYQKAVNILSSQVEKRQLITASGRLNEEKEGTLDSISRWLKAPSKMIHRPWLRAVRWILPACILLTLYYYLATNNYLPFILLVAAGWIVIGIFAKYVTEQHLQISKKQYILDQYAEVLNIFSGIDSGDANKLAALKDISVHAGLAIRKLSQLTGLFDQRLNMLVTIIMNSLFLYDVQCMMALEQWKEQNKKAFEGWIDAVGDIESINSLAGFAYNNPAYTLPVVSEGKPFIDAIQVAHPLIPRQESIPNDFRIGVKDQLHLITGSNMSGKTTFLRTIGVNLLLAQCGAPVCASSFQFVPLALLSSIRISDSLQEHTSYFMAELKRLQQIIQTLQSVKPALVLIDEILRGTNSEDKTHGSEQYIRKLLGYNCLALFATHDLALNRMEEIFPDQIANYCFESSIENDELNFDYKLRPGVAKNKNASFLMKKMQII